ncbi:MAG: TonB family protein [Bacteroidia bacterium]
MQREFIFTDKWLDLVFENRNQSYGAYVLRKRLPGNILVGYLTALIFTATIVFTGYQLSKISGLDIKILNTDTYKLTTYEAVPLPIEEPPLQKEEHKNPPPPPSMEKLIPVVMDSAIVIDEKEKDSETKDINDSKDVADLNVTASNNKTNGTEKTDIKEPTRPLSIAGVEKIPQFPGGDLSLQKFMRNNTNYPHRYLRDDISGTVYISFVVDSSGKVTEIKLAHGIGGFPEFADEAIEAISKMPRWIPGQQNGTHVPVLLTLPVKFSLKKDF